MRSYDEIIDSARDERPFSNGTEGYGWMENWCWRCHNPAEKQWQDYESGKRKTPPKDYPGGCPLIQVALLGKTPVEWLDQWDGESPYPIADRFHCVEFRGPDGGSGEPRPRPDPPGMDGLFERPEQRVRMLKQPECEEVLLFYGYDPRDSYPEWSNASMREAYRAGWEDGRASSTQGDTQ